MSTVEPLAAYNDGVRLAGGLWRPEGQPRGLVPMHPGSGPSDRDNDVLFPPIRAALLEAGVAVCSFDKRGVGGSTGSWLEAGIATQAADLVAGLAAARAITGDLPTGLFGHSQGGWVVLEAAGPAGADLVITNSGPAVTPRDQETYSTEQTLRRHGWREEDVRVGLSTFAAVMDLVREPFDTAWPRARELPMIEQLTEGGVFIPTDARLWSFAGQLMDHDPRPALQELEVPLLALLGEEDPVVPVRRSAEVYRGVVQPELLELHIVPAADHRLQRGDRFADGYLALLTEFVLAHTADAG